MLLFMVWMLALSCLKLVFLHRSAALQQFHLFHARTTFFDSKMFFFLVALASDQEQNIKKNPRLCCGIALHIVLQVPERGICPKHFINIWFSFYTLPLYLLQQSFHLSFVPTNVSHTQIYRINLFKSFQVKQQQQSVFLSQWLVRQQSKATYLSLHTSTQIPCQKQVNCTPLWLLSPLGGYGTAYSTSVLCHALYKVFLTTLINVNFMLLFSASVRVLLFAT